MKERPILFSGPMVRAILDGRKTQTRRVIKDVSADCELFINAGDGFWQQCYRDDSGAIHSKSWLTKCPYGKPGDLLWVRETFARNEVLPLMDREAGEFIYRADLNGRGATKYTATWKPSIHMPRWASRITLRITDIRVERLQDISEGDATAEGVMFGETGFSARVCFVALWQSINGKSPGRTWSDNPWVWVICFEMI